MAITALGSDSGIGTNSNVTITFGAALSPGDIVVAIGGVRKAGQTNTPAAVTTGYTDCFSSVQNAGGNLVTAWSGYKVMGATPDTTFVGLASTSGTRGITYVLFYFSGVDNSTPLDATPTISTGAASTNPDAPSITTITDGAVVIAMASSDAVDTTITSPTGYSSTTQANGSPNSVTTAGSYKAVASHGAEDPASWTNWASGQWCSASVALRPAAAVDLVPYTPWPQLGPIVAQ